MIRRFVARLFGLMVPPAPLPGTFLVDRDGHCWRV